jgi:hypothetical protein
MALSHIAADSSYALMNILFFSIPFLLVYAGDFIYNIENKTWATNYFLTAGIILIILSKPYQMARAIKEGMDLKLSLTQTDSSDNQTMAQLIRRLRQINSTPNKNELCIYIPADEQWYYSSQYFRELAAPFIVPAYAGVPLIGGIPDKMLDYPYYSFFYYKDMPLIKNLEEAKDEAALSGYKKMIIFMQHNNHLQENTIQL